MKGIMKRVMAAAMSLAMVAALTACGGGTDKEAEPKLETLTVKISADKGWTKDSTPAIVHVKGNDEESEVDFYHAVAPSKDNKGTYEVEVSQGEYEVDLVSPVNADGSAYELFDTGEAQKVTVEDGTTLDMTMKHIPADKVTDEMLTAVVKDTKDAITKGDETLKGDAGKAVLEVLDKNIEANPNADKAKDESDKAQDDAKVDEAPVETPADKPADNSNASAQNDNAPASKPSNNGNGSSNQSASKPADKPSQPAKPAHSHSWKNHTATKQVWVSKIVPVYETQTVQVGTKRVSLGWYMKCGGCGAEIAGGSTSPAATAHTIAHMEAGEPSNYHNFEKFTEKPIYETKQVQVGTKDEGHYETQSYTDYQYCDCGATK